MELSVAPARDTSVSGTEDFRCTLRFRPRTPARPAPNAADRRLNIDLGEAAVLRRRLETVMIRPPNVRPMNAR